MAHEILHFKSEFVKQLAEALGVSRTWRRIILDIPYNDAAIIYIEMLGDESKLKVIPINVEGMKVIMEKEK